MTKFQILAVATLGAALVWQFVIPKLPALSLPILRRKDATLQHLEAVIRIRESSSASEVKTACNALLQALLNEVPPSRIGGRVGGRQFRWFPTASRNWSRSYSPIVGSLHRPGQGERHLPSAR